MVRAIAAGCIAIVVGSVNAPIEAAIITYTSDFIADGSRSHFNGFESIPVSGTQYTGGSGPYVEDTIAVEQINGDPPNDIWATYSFVGNAGSRAWYPNGGDHGYTTISLSGGGDFQSVGFNYNTGGGATLILFDLLENGSVVLSGTASLSRFATNYLGFSGGGFDLIRIRDNLTGGTSVTDGSYQALAIDNIETFDVSAVPEPASLTLFGLGAVGLIGFARRRRQAV